MRIHADFPGGNIRVASCEGTVVSLENELRDTVGNWFYWAFCVENANGTECTFHMQPGRCRLGYFGPAVSHDCVNWTWLGSCGENVFTYRFGPDENRVYFAHDILYRPERFQSFAQQKQLPVETLCTSRKGRQVPCVRLGSGKRSVILTARHHACESTGSYVLEGLLDALTETPLLDTTVFCVPFVDYDGVVEGDQGKSRAPHDHNRDYTVDSPSIYPECAAIRQYAEQHGCHYGFDFHSPWHYGGEHDRVFIVQNHLEKLDAFQKFGSLLERSITPASMPYSAKNDLPPETGWNQSGPQFACYMSRRPENRVAFSLETAYFGTPDVPVTVNRLLALGKSFANALQRFILQYEV